MSSIALKAGRLPRLILALAGLSLLLAACANTNEKTVSLNSTFPVSYNAEDRGFESHWPDGPNGYR
jgi:ABC-type oligopeptide transport system substrate-binding subunit